MRTFPKILRKILIKSFAQCYGCSLPQKMCELRSKEDIVDAWMDEDEDDEYLIMMMKDDDDG